MASTANAAMTADLRCHKVTGEYHVCPDAAAAGGADGNGLAGLLGGFAEKLLINFGCGGWTRLAAALIL